MTNKDTAMLLICAEGIIRDMATLLNEGVEDCERDYGLTLESIQDRIRDYIKNSNRIRKTGEESETQ